MESTVRVVLSALRPLFCTLLAGGLISTGETVGHAAARPAAVQAVGTSSPGCTTAGCHGDIRKHRWVHRPVAVDRCDFCHEPTAGATPFQAGPRHEFERAGDNPALCYACHDRLAEEPYVHEPVKMGLCILCHDPHGAEHAFFLRVQTDRELCSQCHRETSHHGDYLHGPVSVGACGACHDPHQSSNPFRLRGDGPQQCGVCHQSDMRGITSAAHVHKPVEDDCTNCHEPHGAPNRLRLVSLPPRLCLDCHEDIDEQITFGQVVHRPVLEGNCGGCHEHHASDFGRLLRGQYSSELYEPFDLARYELCYRCHLPAQVTSARTSDATNFRNGDVNLHFVHVNRAEKGRTCRLCHRIHASSNPRLIAETTPFGAWRLPLNFQLTETGGSCLPGCHRMRAYDRVNAVQNE